ncbi:MAG TPA: hypothetical protein VK789_21795 [Bryobacteraceae bacterium]|nr:hypothetical protein [Bryobacteraceae bacterium]
MPTRNLRLVGLADGSMIRMVYRVICLAPFVKPLWRDMLRTQSIAHKNLGK